MSSSQLRYSEQCIFRNAEGRQILPPTIVAARALQDLAQETWQRLREASEYSQAMGEESITEYNLLELKKKASSAIRLRSISKMEESRIGFDWEMFVGTRYRGWIRYAVQAKKVDSADGIYHQLDHPRDETKPKQIDNLEKYARQHKAVPIYCFYNHSNIANLQDYWQCGLSFDARQMGCTIAPSRRVKDALASRPQDQSFKFIHADAGTIPWRCLLRCPHIFKQYTGHRSSDHPLLGDFTLYPEIPPEVNELFKYPNREASYPHEYEIIPRDVVIIELDDQEFDKTLSLFHQSQ